MLRSVLRSVHIDIAGTSRAHVTYKSLVGHQLTDTCSNTGVWLTVTFTVERYICVCFPMKAIAWCTPGRARHIIIAVCVGAALLTAPEFFATKAAQVPVNVQNCSGFISYSALLRSPHTAESVM